VAVMVDALRLSTLELCRGLAYICRNRCA
jgi:hypothetical protein